MSNLKEEKYNLIIFSDSLTDILDELLINKTVNPLILLLRLMFRTKIEQYKYLKSIQINKLSMKLSKEQLIQAYNEIIKFENKQLSSVNYQRYFQSVTGVKLCKSCGVTDAKIHDDFQRSILGRMKSLDMLSYDFNFKSGKYSGELYKTDLPYYTFKKLNHQIKVMDNEVKYYISKGHKEHAELLKSDIESLKKFIEIRKSNYDSYSQSLSNKVESIVIESEIRKSKEMDSILNTLTSINNSNPIEINPVLDTNSIEPSSTVILEEKVSIIENNDVIEEVEVTLKNDEILVITEEGTKIEKVKPTKKGKNNDITSNNDGMFTFDMGTALDLKKAGMKPKQIAAKFGMTYQKLNKLMGGELSE